MLAYSFSLFQSFSLSPSENTYISASRGPRDKVKKGKIIRNQPQGNFGWAVTPPPTFQPPCVHARTPTQRAWAVAQAPDIGIQKFKQISSILSQYRLCQLKKIYINVCKRACTHTPCVHGPLFSSLTSEFNNFNWSCLFYICKNTLCQLKKKKNNLKFCPKHAPRTLVQ